MQKTGYLSKVIALTALVLILISYIVSEVRADILTYALDYQFATFGNDPMGTGDYWLTAKFEDTGTNSVRLTMSAPNLAGTEFVSGWYFNFDPVLDISQLTITAYNTVAVGTTGVNIGTDLYQADGDGMYDILFGFPPPPGTFSSKFTDNETVIYDITYSGTGSFNAMSFNALSSQGGGEGTYYSAAHVQGIIPDPNICNDPTIPEGTSCSGWIGATTVVPEPISSTLFVIGGAVLGFRRFRRTKKA